MPQKFSTAETSDFWTGFYLGQVLCILAISLSVMESASVLGLHVTIKISGLAIANKSVQKRFGQDY